jgi:hypothetical protein
VVEIVVIPAALAVATFLASTPWLRAFNVPGRLGLFVVASAAPVCISTVAIRLWGRQPLVSYAASAVGLILFLLAAAGLHPDSLWAGLVHGPNRLLTETLPLTGSRALLAGPLVLTWLTGSASTELVTRAGRRRSEMVAAGLTVLVAAFVLAYAATASGPKQHDVAAPLLLCVVAFVALATRLVSSADTPQAEVGETFAADARPSRWRPGLVAAACVAVVAGVLAAAIPSFPALSRPPASLNRTPPLTAAAIVDPVAALAALRDQTPTRSTHTVLTVNTDQPSTGYLAMAVLDQYDGSTWSFHTTFQPTGGRIPPPPGTAVAAEGLTTVGQQYRLLAGLPVPFLPALDRPVAVRGLEAAADASTGMLLPGSPSRDGLSYAVVSRAPNFTLSKVPVADGIAAAAGGALPESGAIRAGDLALAPNTSTAMATAVRFLASLTGQRPAPTVEFLQAVQRGLQAKQARVDPALKPPPSKRKAAPPQTSTAGTSLSQVINAITVYHYATPEQFATLLAMTARYLGVPARLVTGFRVASGSSTGLVPAGHHAVTNKEAWTWVEVPVAGIGWVVVDPTPTRTVAPGSKPPLGGQPAATPPPNRQANAVPIGQIAGHAISKPSTIRVPTTYRLAPWLVVLLVIVGVLAIAALVGPGLAGVHRLSRRRARHRHDPALLAVGAWLEMLDGLYQAGMPAGRGDTSAEVAAEAGRHFSPDLTTPVGEVGALAERAVCSVNDPPDQKAAEHAWELQRSTRRTLHRSLDRRQRARALLVVGSEPRLPSQDSPPSASAAARGSSTPGTG